MGASKDLLTLIEDAQATVDCMADALSAARAVLELNDAPIIGNKASRVIAQQLINKVTVMQTTLLDELTVITAQHGKENA